MESRRLLRLQNKKTNESRARHKETVYPHVIEFNIRISNDTFFFLLNDKKAEKHDFVDIRINNSQWWFNDVMLSEEIELVKLVFKRQRDDI